MSAREMESKAKEYAAALESKEAADSRARALQSEVARAHDVVHRIAADLSKYVGPSIPMRLIRVSASHNLLVQHGKDPVLLRVEMDC